MNKITRRFLMLLAAGTLAFSATSASAQLRQTKLYIDDGSSNFATLNIGGTLAGPATISIPAAAVSSNFILSTLSGGQTIAGGLTSANLLTASNGFTMSGGALSITSTGVNITSAGEISRATTITGSGAISGGSFTNTGGSFTASSGGAIVSTGENAGSGTIQTTGAVNGGTLDGSTSITDGGLTATDVTFAGTGGILSSDNNFTWSGTVLGVTGGVTASGLIKGGSFQNTGGSFTVSGGGAIVSTGENAGSGTIQTMGAVQGSTGTFAGLSNTAGAVDIEGTNASTSYINHSSTANTDIGNSTGTVTITNLVSTMSVDAVTVSGATTLSGSYGVYNLGGTPGAPFALTLPSSGTSGQVVYIYNGTGQNSTAAPGTNQIAIPAGATGRIIYLGSAWILISVN
jgi:hypothetical protein